MGDETKERPLQLTKTRTIALQAKFQPVIQVLERAKAVIYCICLSTTTRMVGCPRSSSDIQQDNSKLTSTSKFAN
jgi:hypothetical protein